MATLTLQSANGAINLVPEDGSGTQTVIVPRDGFTGGKILQVQYTAKVDAFSTTSNSFVDVTGLSVSITPSASSSKILVMASVAFSSEGSGWGEHYFQLARNGSAMLVGTDAGNVKNCCFGGLTDDDGHRTQTGTMIQLDSPSTTSAVTYSVQASCDVGNYGNIVYVNTSAQESTNYSGNGVSTITVMEIVE